MEKLVENSEVLFRANNEEKSSLWKISELRDFAKGLFRYRNNLSDDFIDKISPEQLIDLLEEHGCVVGEENWLKKLNLDEMYKIHIEYEIRESMDRVRDFCENEGLVLYEHEIYALASEMVDSLTHNSELVGMYGEIEETWLQDSKNSGSIKEFLDEQEDIEIKHIPDDQELTVEEINAYLEKHELSYRKETDDIVFRNDDTRMGVLGGYFEEGLYGLKNCTKIDLEALLCGGLRQIRVWEEEYICCDCKDLKSQIEYELKVALQNATKNFDKEFDRCMAEFHAKDNKGYASPKRDAVAEVEHVAKGTAAKSVEKSR